MKVLGDVTINETQIMYPSPLNPRLKGLTPEEVSIKQLADSIRKNGQLQRIIVRQVDGNFETIDGDRRCVAIFKVLKRKMIEATVYEMTDIEAARLRLVANIQKEDLSPIEKGKYCKDLFALLTLEDKLNAEEAWSHRQTRSKYLSQVSIEINVGPSTIINWIRLWEKFSPEIQKMIAANKEDFRRGLVPPTTAMTIANLANRLHADPNALFKLAVQNQWGPAAINYVIRAAKDRENVTLDNVQNFIDKFSVQYIARQCIFETESYRDFLELGKNRKIRFDDFLTLGIKFCLEHKWTTFDNFLSRKLRGIPE